MRCLFVQENVRNPMWLLVKASVVDMQLHVLGAQPKSLPHQEKHKKKKIREPMKNHQTNLKIKITPNALSIETFQKVQTAEALIEGHLEKQMTSAIPGWDALGLLLSNRRQIFDDCLESFGCIMATVDVML